MSKFFLLLLLILSYQVVSAQRFSGGFFAGVTGTQVDGDKFAGFNKGGFTLGATAQYPLSRKFLVAIEIDFTQKGATSKQFVSTSGPAFPRVYSLTVNYAEIPLLVKFYDRQQFGLGLGVEYSRVIGTPKQYRDPNPYYNIRGVEQFENSDVSGIAEASYYFSPQWQLNIRYAYGWTPMGHSADSDYSGGACYNNVLMVRVGYIFGQEFDEKKKKEKPANVQ
jgi:hypothetical protein